MKKENNVFKMSLSEFDTKVLIEILIMFGLNGDVHLVIHNEIFNIAQGDLHTTVYVYRQH